jgi:Ni,Fe-hydrogenase I large subunit
VHYCACRSEVAHYFEALQWQKEIVKIHALFGGKNPHPHYLVGGMASVLNPTGLHEALPLDLTDPNQIREHVAHSWYDYPEGKTDLHPLEGVTTPR